MIAPEHVLAMFLGSLVISLFALITAFRAVEKASGWKKVMNTLVERQIKARAEEHHILYGTDGAYELVSKEAFERAVHGPPPTPEETQKRQEAEAVALDKAMFAEPPLTEEELEKTTTYDLDEVDIVK